MPNPILSLGHLPVPRGLDRVADDGRGPRKYLYLSEDLSYRYLAWDYKPWQVDVHNNSCLTLPPITLLSEGLGPLISICLSV